MYVLFALIVVPTLLAMTAWVVVTIHRLCFAPRGHVYRAGRIKSFVASPELEAAAGVMEPVGVREIREGQRRVLREHATVRYDYAGICTHRVPSSWIDDLWRRRN